MVKLKVKHFGPIKEGYTENDGYLAIPDVTLFIGDQGSGKSSIAKILSTCSWIEKTMLKDHFIYGQETNGIHIFNNSEQHTGENYDLKYRLEYQNIQHYFSENSYIDYIGDYYRITYADSETSFECLHVGKGQSYIQPQIMYSPAERNFISVVEGAKNVKNLPSPLYTFLDEYENAVSVLAGEKIKLPLGNFLYQYDDSIKQGVILDVGNNYRIMLSEASSGLQSATPLFLVTDYLSNLIKGKYETLSKKRLSLADEMSKSEMTNIARDNGIDQETIKELKAIENRFSNKRFMNIVEEMEQNLYPKSQQNILYDLIRCVNSMPGNSLVLTTHSPYVINYLSLAIKAYTIHNKIRQQKESLIQKLDNIVPIESIISGERVIIYELDQSGTIRKLTTFGDGVPSDENFLNDSLRISNEKTTLRL